MVLLDRAPGRLTVVGSGSTACRVRTRLKSEYSGDSLSNTGFNFETFDIIGECCR